MNISSINNSMQNFKGIMVLKRTENDVNTKTETFIDTDYYDYYPFTGETKADINKTKKANTKSEYNPNSCLEGWGSFYASKVDVKKALPITQIHYERMLDKGLDDSAIIEIFS